MVPRAAEPPAVPLTDQFIEVLVLPETAAVNWKLLPARMLAAVGETLTEVEAGVAGLLGLPLELLLELLEPVPAQPAATRAPSRAQTGQRIAHRKWARIWREVAWLSTHLDRHAFGNQCQSGEVTKILDRREEQGQEPR